jgi:ATP-binding cassette, subfamily G (WHITE), member 2, SNQ2
VISLRIMSGAHLTTNDSTIPGMWPMTPPEDGRRPSYTTDPSATTPALEIPTSNDSATQNDLGLLEKLPVLDSTEQETIESPIREDVGDKKEGFAPIQTEPSRMSERPRPGNRTVSENDLFKSLSRRRTIASGAGGPDGEEQQEIDRLMSRMFGKSRHEASDEEKTRHVGVIFKNLTVKGVGLGASLQPTTGDILLAFPRYLRTLFSRGPRRASGKPPVRTILDDFSGCVKPGEMLLVLGAPGSGCSTFLKVIGNQRAGYESVEGDVTYGGTDAETMAEKYRGEILYGPELDFHYPSKARRKQKRIWYVDSHGNVLFPAASFTKVRSSQRVPPSHREALLDRAYSEYKSWR